MWWIYWIYCHTLIDFRLCSGLSTATSVYFGAESSKLVSLRQWGSSDMKVRWRGSWWGLGCHESGEERGIAQVEKWKIGDKGRGGEERTVRWGGGGGEWSKVERAVSYVFVWKVWKAVCMLISTNSNITKFGAVKVRPQRHVCLAALGDHCLLVYKGVHWSPS